MVAGAIERQMKMDQTEFVWEDMRTIPQQELTEHFPNIVQHCRENHYDVTKECIPVVPAQHYFMGGIKVDLDSRTSVKGLYAVGETSCTGVHGANRLASNSLLEALVFSKRAAEDIIKYLRSGMVKNTKAIFTGEMAIFKHSLDEVRAMNKNLLLQAIKQGDENFYAKWCHEEYKCR